MPPHLTVEERDRIAELRYKGFSQVEVARDLGRSPSTISRELSRNRTKSRYCAGLAQRQSERRRRDRPLQKKMDDPVTNAFVRSGLAFDWSPDEIAGRIGERTDSCQTPCRQLSAPTIYRWIRTDACRKHWESGLRRRGKRPYRRKPAEPSDKGRIRDRPKVIEDRLRIGDFEGDTVVGPPGTGVLITLVDRKARLTLMIKTKSKNAKQVEKKIRARLATLRPDQRHSTTFDNGTEFAACHRLEKTLGVKIYLAEPGCPFQRGTNENTNGLIRQYFPKGTRFQDISYNDVALAENLLNDRPRKCLGYKTPNEVFFGTPASSRCV